MTHRRPMRAIPAHRIRGDSFSCSTATLMISWTQTTTLLLVVAALACSPSEASNSGETSTGEPPTDPGLAVVCEGEGSPAIVFEAGLSRTASDFIVIADLLNVDTRVCRYTRRGLTGSPPLDEGTRTSADWRDDLVAWMDDYGVTDPAVFVAHSAGGITIRMLRDSHPDRVAGVVMIDTSQPALLQYDLETFPAEQAAEVQTHAAGANTEQWDISTSFAALEGLDEDFGAIPMAVLVAGTFPSYDFLTAEENAARFELWTQGQMDLAALSTASQYTLVEGAGHFIQNSNPELVVAEIERVLAAAR